MKRIAMLSIMLFLAATAVWAAPNSNGYLQSKETDIPGVGLENLDGEPFCAVPEPMDMPVIQRKDIRRNRGFSSDMRDVFAQAPDTDRKPPEGPPPGPGWENDPDREYKMKLMVMYRLVNELNLDQDSARKFLAMYIQYVEKRDKLDKELHDLTQSVYENTDNEAVSTSSLKTQVDKLLQTQRDMYHHRMNFLEQAKTMLDDRQYFKLVVFEDKLKMDLMTHLMSRRRDMNELSDEDRARIEKNRETRREKFREAESKYREIIENEMSKVRENSR